MRPVDPQAHRAQVVALVHAFYREVRADELLAPLFEKSIPGDWAPHLARMVEFWCTVLLHTRSFRGDVLRKHVVLADQLRGEHFSRWLSLWRQQVFQHLPEHAAAAALDTAVGIGRNLYLGCFGVVPRIEIDERSIRFFAP